MSRFMLSALSLSWIGCGACESPGAPVDPPEPSASTSETESRADDGPHADREPDEGAPPTFEHLGWAAAEHARFVPQGIGGETLHGLRFSTDGRALAVGSSDGTVAVLDPSTAEVLAVRRFDEYGEVHFTLGIAADTVVVAGSSALGSGGALGAIWRWREGRVVYEYGQNERHCAAAPDGERFVCDGYEAVIGDARSGEVTTFDEETSEGMASPDWVHETRILTAPQRGRFVLRDASSLASVAEVTASRYAAADDHLVFLSGDEVFALALPSGDEISRTEHRVAAPDRLVISSDGALAGVANREETALYRPRDGHLETIPHSVYALAPRIAVVEERDSSLRRMVLEGRRLGMRLAPPPPSESMHYEIFGGEPEMGAVAPDGSVAYAHGGDGYPPTAGPARVHIVRPAGTVSTNPGSESPLMRATVEPGARRLLLAFRPQLARLFDADGARDSSCGEHFRYRRVDWETSTVLGRSEACSLLGAPSRRLFASTDEWLIAMSPDGRFALGSEGSLVDRRSDETARVARPPDVCDLGYHDDEICGGSATFSSDGRFVFVHGYAVEGAEPTVLIGGGQTDPIRTFQGGRSGVFANDSSFLVHAGGQTLAIVDLVEDVGSERWLVGSEARMSNDAEGSGAKVALSPDGRLVAWAGGDAHGVRLVSLSDGDNRDELHFGGYVEHLRWSEAGHQLAVKTSAGLYLHDLRTDQTLRIGTHTGRRIAPFVGAMRVFCLDHRLRVLRDGDDGDLELLDLAACGEREDLPTLDDDGEVLTWLDGSIARVRRVSDGRELFFRGFTNPDGEQWIAYDRQGRYLTSSESAAAWLRARTEGGTLAALDAANRDEGLLRRFFR